MGRTLNRLIYFTCINLIVLALQLNWNRISSWVFSRKFPAHLFIGTPLVGCFYRVLNTPLRINDKKINFQNFTFFIKIGFRVSIEVSIFFSFIEIKLLLSVKTFYYYCFTSRCFNWNFTFHSIASRLLSLSASILFSI